MLKKSFGVGCFHFGFIGTASSLIFNPEEWVRNLENKLCSITNISEIVIDGPRNVGEVEFKNIDEIPTISEGIDGAFPDSFGMYIKFKLYIPERIQREIKDSSNPRTYTENFLVEIFYSFYMPVAIITPIDPTKKPKPATSVMLVRNFLESEFKKNKFEYIDFQWLGPSPFHVDFYIYEEDQNFFKDDEKYLISEKKQLGYNEIEIKYNNKYYDNEEEFFYDNQLSITDEFAIYYKMVSIRNFIDDKWMGIYHKIQLMVDEFVSNKRLKLNKSISKNLDRVLVEFSNFKMLNIECRNDIENMYSRKYQIDEGFVKSHLTNEKNEKIDYPTKEVGELLYLFEQRKVKKTEYLILIISALLGGVVGSLLTGIF